MSPLFHSYKNIFCLKNPSLGNKANFLVLTKDIIIQTRTTKGNYNIQMEEERIECLREEKGLRFKAPSMFIDKDEWTVYNVTRNGRENFSSNFFLFRMQCLHE